MLTNPKSDADSAASRGSVSKRFIDQWGGKFAFFFSYMHLSHDLTTGLLAALLPFIRQDLGLNYLQSGFLVSAFSLTAGFSQLLGGWLSDRISKRNAISIGLGGVGLSSVAIVFAPSYEVLLVVLVALGVFSGFYHPSSISALSSHFEPQQRGRVVALHMLGGSLGFGLGPVLGAVIASALNWHWAYVILGLPALVAAGMAFAQLKLEPVKTAQEFDTPQAAGQKSRGALWQVFRPAFAILAISIAMQLATGPIMSFVSLFLIDVHHLSEAGASMWVTIIRLGGLAGNLVGGWLTDRWGRRNTIFLTLILFGPVVLILTILPSSFALGAVFVIFGWLMAMRETTMQTLLMDSSAPNLRATVIGIYFAFGQQGSSIIQPVAGDLMDVVGIGGVFNTIAFISIGLSALAVIFLFRKNGVLRPGVR
jgi:MFS transporter, FSR family, fosmidomycin resistance protein